MKEAQSSTGVTGKLLDSEVLMEACESRLLCVLRGGVSGRLALRGISVGLRAAGMYPQFLAGLICFGRWWLVGETFADGGVIEEGGVKFDCE